MGWAVASRQSIGFKEIRKLVIAIPPVEEQQHILIAYIALRNLSTAQSKIVGDIIAGLEDLKMRLISDTVTGKIDVRGIEIPEYEFVDEDTDTGNEDGSEEETEEQED